MKRRVLAVGMTTAVAVAAWWWLPRAQDDGVPWFANRIWAERMPTSERDMVLYFTPVRVGSQRFGVIQRQSSYRVVADRFVWTRSDDDLQLGFPQDGKETTVKVRSWRCPGEAPEPFDLCLELSTGDERVTLYSRRHWVWPRDGEEPLEVPVGEIPALPDRACDRCEEGVSAALRGLPWERSGG